MKRRIKLVILLISKWIGLFKASEVLTRRGLRILCYHNFSDGDEVDWWPGLFTKPQTFMKRLQYLKNSNYLVLRLNDAIDALYKNELPDNSIVITIDDGWKSIKEYAHEILAKYNLPYTIYITSYYSIKETPIFNIVIPYMLWKASKNNYQFGALKLPFSRSTNAKNNNYTILVEKIIKFGHSKLTHSERCAFSSDIAKQLGIEYELIEKSTSFSLLTGGDLRELFDNGVDLQLHTHTHKWPVAKDEAINELTQNRNYLESITGVISDHFCYPDGLWKKVQFPFLKILDIKSATTTDRGFNYETTNKYQLKRFLDSENIKQVEFEAEICGFFEICRKLRQLIKADS